MAATSCVSSPRRRPLPPPAADPPSSPDPSQPQEERAGGNPPARRGRRRSVDRARRGRVLDLHLQEPHLVIEMDDVRNRQPSTKGPPSSRSTRTVTSSTTGRSPT